MGKVNSSKIIEKGGRRKERDRRREASIGGSLEGTLSIPFGPLLRECQCKTYELFEKRSLQRYPLTQKFYLR